MSRSILLEWHNNTWRMKAIINNSYNRKKDQSPKQDLSKWSIQKLKRDNQNGETDAYYFRYIM